MTIHAAFLEKQAQDGLTKEEITGLLDKIDSPDDMFIPAEVEADAVESVAIGFVAREIYDIMDYNYTAFQRCLQPVMDDMANEVPSHIYSIDLYGKTINIWFDRNL